MGHLMAYKEHEIVLPGGGIMYGYDEDTEEEWAYNFATGEPVDPSDIDLLRDEPYYVAERHDGDPNTCDECRERGIGAFRGTR